MSSGRPRNQNGHVYPKGPSWIGRYRTNDSKSQKRKAIAFRLGAISEITEKQAQARLREIISRDSFQSTALETITAVKAIPARCLTERKAATPTARGMISELLVAADLLNKGYEVYQSFNPAARTDLLAMAPDWSIVRIEVKTASWEDGQICCNIRPQQLGCFDLIAFVMSDGSIEYRKPSEIIDMPLSLKRKRSSIPVGPDSYPKNGTLEDKYTWMRRRQVSKQ